MNSKSLCALTVAALVACGPLSIAASDPPSYAYHLRILRAGTIGGGAAIGVGNDAATPVVLPSEELWGSSEQFARLEELLGVQGVDAVTGFWIQPRNGAQYELARRLYIHGKQLDLAFHAVPPESSGLPHRIAIDVTDVDHPEIPLTESTLLIATDRTVALAIPGVPGKDWLVLAITALDPSQAKRRITDAEEVALMDGPEFSVPRRIFAPEFRYPDSAKAERRGGKIILELIIDREGIPRAPMVLQMTPGDEDLVGAAVGTVSAWRYEPARRNGVPVAVWITVVANFELQ